MITLEKDAHASNRRGSYPHAAGTWHVDKSNQATSVDYHQYRENIEDIRLGGILVQGFFFKHLV